MRWVHGKYSIRYLDIIIVKIIDISMDIQNFTSKDQDDDDFFGEIDLDFWFSTNDNIPTH